MNRTATSVGRRATGRLGQADDSMLLSGATGRHTREYEFDTACRTEPNQLEELCIPG